MTAASLPTPLTPEQWRAMHRASLLHAEEARLRTRNAVARETNAEPREDDDHGQ